MVTGGFREKTPKILGSFAQNFVYGHFLAASMGFTERVPKPDMHNMERLELYLGC